MKNLLFLLALLASTAFFACTESPDDKCDAEGDCLYVTLDGEEFISTTVGGDFFIIVGIETFSIGGVKGSEQIDALQIALTNIEEKSYDITSPGGYSDISIVLYDATGDPYYFDEGTFTVTNLDTEAKLIEATFDGKLSSSDDPSLPKIVATGGYLKFAF